MAARARPAQAAMLCAARQGRLSWRSRSGRLPVHKEALRRPSPRPAGRAVDRSAAGARAAPAGARSAEGDGRQLRRAGHPRQFGRGKRAGGADDRADPREGTRELRGGPAGTLGRGLARAARGGGYAGLEPSPLTRVRLRRRVSDAGSPGAVDATPRRLRCSGRRCALRRRDQPARPSFVSPRPTARTPEPALPVYVRTEPARPSAVGMPPGTAVSTSALWTPPPRQEDRCPRNRSN